MNHDQAIRYARNISLAEIGQSGQAGLMRARVLVIGAGGLGSPLLLYLAATGVGTIGIVDDDRVALSNLQRQILHETGDIGRPKTASASEALYDLNPDVKVIQHHCRLDASNIDNIIKDYDLVADGCDNFETRFLVNAACLRHQKTLVSAAIIGFSGQLYTFKPYLGAPHPCYQCLYPELPSPSATPRCSDAGVLGSIGGQMGSWQATQVLKELLNIGQSLSGYMMLLDALNNDVRKVKLPRDPACLCCAKISTS
jgi:adenylyltransferase/sulfurtransferase